MGRLDSPAILAGVGATMMMAIPFIMLLALVLLGGLAAVVFGIVYAIANKRPGVAVASIVVPIGLFIGVGLLAAMFWSSARVVHVGDPARVSWTVDSPTPAMPQMPAMPPMPPMPAAPQFSPGFPAWRMIALVFVACVVFLLFFRKRTCHDGERRGGWGKTLAVAVLLVVALNYVLLRASYVPSRVAQDRAEVARELTEQIRRDVETAERKAIEAQRKVDETQDKAASQMIEGASIQELWEKLNQPRIKLDHDEHGASLTVGEEVNQVAVVAADEGGANLVVPISDESPESIARSLARLERMVEQVSAVADRLSDAGTLIGKGMIALNETIDSRAKPKARIETVSSTMINAPEHRSDGSPSVASDAYNAVGPTPQKIVIRIDNSKLSEFNQSVQDVTRALNYIGFWNFQIDTSDKEMTSINAVGEPEAGFDSKLLDMVVGHAGRQQRPVHLAEIATVVGLAPKPTTSSACPAWVDEPPKNVGNVRRQVISVGDFVTHEECSREMDRQLYLATLQRLVELTGESEQNLLSTVYAGGMSHRSDPWKPNPADLAALYLNRMGIGIDFIRSEIAKKEHFETVQRSVGPMKKVYTQVEFSHSVDQELRQRWDELRRQDRFELVGVGAGAVLGLIGLAFGLLKVDTWTRGYYTKRLFLGVPAAIIGILALLGLAAG